MAEEDIIQSNAELFSDIYAEDSITSDMLTEQDNTIISEVLGSVSVTDETDELSTQTDLQVMILTENMAAFTNEDNISDSMNILIPTENSVMDQILIGTQVQ